VKTKTYQVIEDGKRVGSIKTDDIVGFAARAYKGFKYEIKDNKLIFASMTLGEAMKFAMDKMRERDKASTEEEETDA